MIATAPQLSATATWCDCAAHDVTCGCNHHSEASTAGTISISANAATSGSTAIYLLRPNPRRTPKYRPLWDDYPLPRELQAQLPTHRTQARRTPTQRATAKGVRNWRQQ